MNAHILSVGDELALGQTVDTNSAWMSQQLAAVGCAVGAHMTVADDQPSIERAIRYLSDGCDVLLISGGIGPTEDDLTRQALAEVLDRPLEMSALWLDRLQSFFAARGRPMPETNKIQAMIPRGAILVDNTAGTAAGIRARYNPLRDMSMRLSDQEPPHRPGAMTDIFVMPGVPKEMKAMFERNVLPHVRERSAGAAIVSRTLHTFGLGESWVAEKLGELMTRGRNPSVGTTVTGGIVSLRVNSRFESRERAVEESERTVAECRAALGDLIFGSDDETLPHLVGGLLKQGGKTVATAESCTGGLIAKMLTDIAGSSAYFTRGWVTYSNDAKSREIHVEPAILAAKGAVSIEVAEQMAAGALRESGADFALSVTGIAGPDGGTAEKPVGTVCLGLATNTGGETRVRSRAFNFPGDREMVRDRSAKMALSMLRYELLGADMPF